MFHSITIQFSNPYLKNEKYAANKTHQNNRANKNNDSTQFSAIQYGVFAPIYSPGPPLPVLSDILFIVHSTGRVRFAWFGHLSVTSTIFIDLYEHTSAIQLVYSALSSRISSFSVYLRLETLFFICSHHGYSFQI